MIIYIILFLLVVLLIFLIYILKQNQNTELLSENYMNDFNNDLLSFTSFLDNFNKYHLNSNDYIVQKEYHMNVLHDNYCKHCKKYKECYLNNKFLVFNFFNSAITRGNNIKMNNTIDEITNMIKYCPSSNAIINTGETLKKRLNNNYDALLKSQIGTLSNTLKNFTMDKNKSYNILNIKTMRYIEKIYTNTSVTFHHISSSLNSNFIIDFYYKKLSNSQIIKLGKYTKKYYNKEFSISLVDENKFTKVTISPKIKYKITYSARSIAKDNKDVCGDNFLFMNNQSDTHFIAALSDGMGNGFAAHQESKGMLNLISDLNKTNISTDNSFDILNTFFKLKEYNDLYATLDYLDLSLCDGKANFYKMGSASSFLIREDGTVIKIDNSNLPLGINNLISKEEYDIHANDIIYIFSDGVLEYIDENLLIKEMVSFANLPIQKVVHNISTIFTSNNIIHDDLSIIGLKVSKIA